MGCTGSKENNDNKIDFEFEDINILRFDSFFRDARALLQIAEEIRAGVEDSKEEGAEIAFTWQLKEPKYTDTVQVLFWAASAENKGHISETDLDITKEAPFVTMNHKKITNETFKLYQTFSEYLKTLIDGPEKLKDACEQLQVLAEKAEDLVKNGKDEIQNSSLDFVGKAKAVAKLAKNSNKLRKEVVKCKHLQEVLKTAKTDMLELLPKLKDLAFKSDEVGAKAYAAKLIKPHEIFLKYHTGQKKAPKEIEAELKAKKEAKK